MNAASQSLLWAFIATMGICSIAALIAVKVVLASATLFKMPISRAPWFDTLSRRVPAWRLFGQSTGSFEIRIAVAEQHDGEAPSLEVEPVRRRRPWDWAFNPDSRYRAFRRRAANSLIETSVRFGELEAMANPFAEQIRSIGALMLPSPSEGSPRSTYWVIVIVDRGYYAASPPEALVQLGPYQRVK